MNKTLKRSYEELGEDAREYLNKLAAYLDDPSEDNEVALEVGMGVLRVHTASLTELLDEDYNESLVSG